MTGRMIELAHATAEKLGTTETEQVWTIVFSLMDAYTAGKQAGHLEHGREQLGQCPLCGDE